MVAGMGLGIGIWRGVLANAPDFPHLAMEPGEYSSVVIHPTTGEELARFHAGVNRTWVPLEMIPMHVRNAFLAIEDERFYYHNGIDIRSIGRAVNELIRSGGSVTQGASTITQQVIKNRLERFDSDLTTKLQEQYLAVQLERNLAADLGCHIAAKDWILEIYLNTINLGRTNHGVQAAAMFYYGIDVWELSIAQAATIASITQNPSRLPPDRFPDNNWRRTQNVLDNMLRNGFITEQEHYEAMNSDVYSTLVLDEYGGYRETVSPFDCFTDALFVQLRNELVNEFGITSQEAENMIFRGGLRIYTTQNLEFQEIVDDVLTNDELFPTGRQFEYDVTYHLSLRNNVTGQPRHEMVETTVNTREEGIEWIYRMQYELMGSQDVITLERRIFTPQPQAAFVLIDQHTGHVLAIRGLRGEKDGSRGHCRATRAVRSPGSQLKPLIFAAGYDLGILTPASPIEDAPWAIHPQGGARYQPGNWWRGGYRGLQSTRTAIHTSMNILSVVALVDIVGIETAFAYLQNMGFTTLEGTFNAGTANERAWSDRIPALALGGLTEGVHLIELAGAYAAIANQGMHNQPIFFTHVLDRNGNLLLQMRNNHPPRQVLNRQAAYLVTNTMIDTLHAYGATGHAQRFQRRSDIAISGKTGTSQTNRDSGFVGFTPYFTGAVWMGFDTPRAMSSPGGYRARLWRTIMERVHEELPGAQFQRPDGIITASVCRDSGHPATDLCRSDPRGSRVTSDIFAAGTVPSTPCPVHAQITVCYMSGLINGPLCHPYNVVNRVGMLLPPLPDFARNASIRGREFAFSHAVLEGQVCDICDGTFEYWYDDDPYHEDDYPQDDPYGDDNHVDPPWDNFPFPTPMPPGEDGYAPIPTPIPPHDPTYPPDDDYIPFPTPTPPEYDDPPDEWHVSDDPPYTGDGYDD